MNVSTSLDVITYHTSLSSQQSTPKVLIRRQHLYLKSLFLSQWVGVEKMLLFFIVVSALVWRVNASKVYSF